MLPVLVLQNISQKISAVSQALLKSDEKTNVSSVEKEAVRSILGALILGDKSDLDQTVRENFSATGMLIRTDRRWEKGIQIEFEFSIPNDPRPVRGVAEVVRQTLVGRDAVGGVGLRFLSFAGDSHRRYEAFIQRL